MGLNKSSGNMYKFISHTWNTVKGACPHDCSYCYMKRWGKLNPVRFDETELKTDLGKDKFIFVGSSCDMFANNIPSKWIINTLDYCNRFDNKYLFQSKNPYYFGSYKLPDKSVICTTIESNVFYPDIMHESPEPINRAYGMMRSNLDNFKKYVTIEPIMDFDLNDMLKIIKNCTPEQVNIGANTSKIKLPEPSTEKLYSLINELEKFTIVHQKKNLKRLL